MSETKIKKTDLQNMTADEIRKYLGGTKVHAVSIQKGGTGKTLTTSDLGYTLAQKGFKVLLIDADPQASLSMLCGINIADLEVKGLQDIYDLYLQLDGEMDFDDIGKLANYISPLVRNGQFKVMTKAQVKALLEKFKGNELIDITKVNDSLKTDLNWE